MKNYDAICRGPTFRSSSFHKLSRIFRSFYFLSFRWQKNQPRECTEFSAPLFDIIAVYSFEKQCNTSHTTPEANSNHSQPIFKILLRDTKSWMPTCMMRTYFIGFICIAVMNNWHSNGMVYQDGSFSKIFNSLQFYVKTAQRNNINYENSLILKTSVFQTFNTRVYLHGTKISDQFMLTVMFTKDFWVFLWNSLLQVSDTPDETCS